MTSSFTRRQVFSATFRSRTRINRKGMVARQDRTINERNRCAATRESVRQETNTLCDGRGLGESDNPPLPCSGPLSENRPEVQKATHTHKQDIRNTERKEKTMLDATPLPIPPSVSKIPPNRRALKRGILSGGFLVSQQKDPKESRVERRAGSGEKDKGPKTRSSASQTGRRRDPSEEKDVNLSPEVWGPPFWSALFFLSSSPLSETHFPSLLSSLEAVLPCKGCRRSYSLHTRALKIESSVSDPVEWLWRLKHLVQADLGRASPPLSQIRRKHIALSPPSDLLLLDVLVFVALSRPSHFVSFLTPLLSLLSPLRPSSPLLSLSVSFSPPSGLETEGETEGIMNQLYSVRVSLSERDGLAPPSRNDFDDQYSVSVED